MVHNKLRALTDWIDQTLGWFFTNGQKSNLDKRGEFMW